MFGVRVSFIISVKRYQNNWQKRKKILTRKKSNPPNHQISLTFKIIAHNIKTFNKKKKNYIVNLIFMGSSFLLYSTEQSFLFFRAKKENHKNQLHQLKNMMKIVLKIYITKFFFLSIQRTD